MNIIMVSCSRRGYELLETISYKLKKIYPDCDVKCICKSEALHVGIGEDERLADFITQSFDKVDALVFACAAGIAVRMIAPCITHKSKDPAVVVLDELGIFCIPILSGHLGGANELARCISGLSGATPVITTATDINSVFAIDEFARINGLYLDDFYRAKDISRCLLDRRNIRVFSRYDIEGEVPQNVVFSVSDFSGDKYDSCKNDMPCVYIDVFDRATETALPLVPGSLFLGVGCKKDTPYQDILSAYREFIREYNIAEKAISGIASIDLKKDEEGLICLAEKMGVGFCTYTRDELLSVEGEFSESEFVRQVTGVDNVCERSAVLAAERALNTDASLLVTKKAYKGVTFAVAEAKIKLRWKG